MTTPDERIGDALKQLAEQLKVVTAEPPVIEPSRRWMATGVAATLLAASIVGGVLVLDRSHSNNPRIITTNTSVEPTVPTTRPTIGSTASTGDASAPLTRPILELAGCGQPWAQTPVNPSPYRPFARATTNPVPVQVFTAPSGSINEPYVVVERFSTDQQHGLPAASTDVDGRRNVVVQIGPAGGAGSAQALLPDSSELYVRGRGFDEGALRAIAQSLISRPADAAIPGFDLSTRSTPELRLLAETNDINRLPATITTFGCTRSNGRELYVDLVSAAPAYAFTAFLDQPTPLPVATTLSDGSILAIRGLSSTEDATTLIGSIRQATTEQWTQLLAAPRRDDAGRVVPDPADSTLPTTPAVADGEGSVQLPTVVPAHGIAYDTADGVTVANLDGTVVFHLTDRQVVDRSRDSSTMAAVVSRSRLDPSAAKTYGLLIGTDRMALVDPPANESSVVFGWTNDGPPTDCVRDARRAGSAVLLCTAVGSTTPREIVRRATSGARTHVAGAPPTAPSDIGHWADAIEGPDHLVAATWSAECETLIAYRVAADGTLSSFFPGGSAVQGWVDHDVLVSRFGVCGTTTADDGLYRISADGIATRIPTPDAINTPVVW